MMSFFPSLTEEYSSKMTPVELAARMSQFVEPKGYWIRTPSFLRGERSKTFEGDISATNFNIRPIISYRNSCIPMIKGTISPTENGSRIKIEMNLHTFVKYLVMMWLGMVGMGFVTICISMVESLTFSPICFFPVGMWLISYFLVKKGFDYEAKPALRALEGIFNMPAIQPDC